MARPLTKGMFYPVEIMYERLACEKNNPNLKKTNWKNCGKDLVVFLGYK